jgi:hypothetical protein
VVEHSLYHPKVNGLSQATTNGAERVRNGYKSKISMVIEQTWCFTRQVGLYLQHFIHFVNYQLAEQAIVLDCIQPERLMAVKSTNLLGWFVSYEQNKVLWIYPLACFINKKATVFKLKQVHNKNIHKCDNSIPVCYMLFSLNSSKDKTFLSKNLTNKSWKTSLFSHDAIWWQILEVMYLTYLI